MQHGLPTERDVSPFDPPSQITSLRSTRPVSPMLFHDGHEGWLVTGYEAVRQALADTRFSSRQDLGILHMPYPTPGMPEQTEPSPQEPGVFLSMDPPDHTRLRRKLTGAFTVKRMKALEDGIIEITERRLDELAKLTPPVDLVREFALPVPSLVICEMLGVPYADRETFQTNSAKFMERDVALDDKIAAYVAINTYLAGLITGKRAEPADDLLSDLARDEDLSIEELTGMAFLLLLAGHETTANMLALGTFALLEHPEQMAALRSAPELVPDAVEELLRYLTVTDIFFRYAAEDIEFFGRRSGKVRRSSCRCWRATATRSATTTPTRWTCTATLVATSRSATACTSASVSSWPASRCAPGSRDCCAASRRWNSPFPPAR